MAGGTIGFEQITVSSASIPFTTPRQGGVLANGALVTVETAPIRFRTDGGTPTASVGHLVQAGGSFEVIGPGDVFQFRAIRATGTDGAISVTYYGTQPGV